MRAGEQTFREYHTRNGAPWILPCVYYHAYSIGPMERGAYFSREKRAVATAAIYPQMAAPRPSVTGAKKKRVCTVASGGRKRDTRCGRTDGRADRRTDGRTLRK